MIKTHGPGYGRPSSAPTILNSASPGGATSFPLPLLILGGLAILLVAAGGIGLLIRRRQSGAPGPRRRAAREIPFSRSAVRPAS